MPDFNPVLCSQSVLGNRYNISFDYVDFPDFLKRSNISLFDIAKKLELMINDNDLRQKFIKRGYVQVKKFSWEKTARETLIALEGLMIKD